MIEVFDFDQGSADWFEARAGLPTASEFATVMAKGKDGGASVTRARYMRKLAGEILTGEPDPDTYTNTHMERGKAMEDEARNLYAYLKNLEPQRVGFIRNGQKGASPDALVDVDGGLELKSASREVQIERLQRDALPPEHKAQVLGNIWVCEREWWDFVSYCPKLPPLIIRVPRDDIYIRQISAAVDAFNEELALLVERIRNYSRPPREILKNQLVQSMLAG